jgi:flagellar biosynthesis protein FlhF
MQIKKFEASDMKEALKLVKHEFGPDAVILSVKKVENSKGLFGFNKSSGIEVTAATDTDSFDDRERSIYNMKKVANERRAYKLDLIDIYQKENRNRFDRGIKNNNGKSITCRKTERRHLAKWTKELFVIYNQMLNQDVNENIALEMMCEIKRDDLNTSAIEIRDQKTVFVKVLKDAGISSGRLKLEKDKQKIVAVVGTTGVGKTTTVAKLAAYAKAKGYKNRIGLITLDDNKIGAIEQLKKYSEIIGVPLNTATSYGDLRRVINRFNRLSLILIDTPGFSQTNQEKIKGLSEILTKNLNIEINLILSAASSEKTMADITKKFAIFNMNKIIFTKLDETLTFGFILNQLYRTKIPVSYFTNGQQVPEDIEIATIEKLADMIIDTKTSERYLTGPPEVLAENIADFENRLNHFEEKSLNYTDVASIRNKDVSSLRAVAENRS